MAASDPFAARRAWQRMLSGRRLDLLNPSPLDVEIEDIAHGLARVARWNGQTRGDHAFSVAQHCVLVETLLSNSLPSARPALAARALLHDAPEYVIGDMISPFKAAVGIDYKAFEKHTARRHPFAFRVARHAADENRNAHQAGRPSGGFFRSDPTGGVRSQEARKCFGVPKVYPERGSAPIPALEPLAPKDASAQYLRKFQQLS